MKTEKHLVLCYTINRFREWVHDWIPPYDEEGVIVNRRLTNNIFTVQYEHKTIDYIAFTPQMSGDKLRGHRFDKIIDLMALSDNELAFLICMLGDEMMNEITLEQALILLDESRQHNAAIVNRLYEIFNIDSSDGEVRAKWALLEASKVVKERAALAAQVEVLRSALQMTLPSVYASYKNGVITNKELDEITKADAETPQFHLAEILNNAKIEGFKACWKHVHKEYGSDLMVKTVKQYAESIR